MKNFIRFVLFSALGALLIAVSVLTTSCDRAKREFTPPDSVFQNRIDAYLPIAMQKLYTFESPTDAILYKQERQRQLEFDSIFCNLSDQELANICAVLTKQQSQFSISDIVYEYKANKRIYSALPETPLPAEPDPERDSIPDSVKIVAFKSL
jgi:hypothetical protein